MKNYNHKQKRKKTHKYRIERAIKGKILTILHTKTKRKNKKLQNFLHKFL